MSDCVRASARVFTGTRHSDITAYMLLNSQSSHLDSFSHFIFVQDKSHFLIAAIDTGNCMADAICKRINSTRCRVLFRSHLKLSSYLWVKHKAKAWLIITVFKGREWREDRKREIFKKMLKNKPATMIAMPHNLSISVNYVYFFNVWMCGVSFSFLELVLSLLCNWREINISSKDRVLMD